MTQITSQLGCTARRTTVSALGLLAAATGTAAAHGGSGGMMGGGTGGLFGGTMGLWGLLWMGLSVAVPAYLLYILVSRDRGGRTDSPQAVLRERYARGDLSDEEFDRRRERLDRSE